MIELFIYLAVLTVVGGILLFKGRDFFKPMVSLTCFITTFNFVVEELGTKDSDLIIAGLSGLVVAMLTGFVIKCGVFLLGAAAGIIMVLMARPFVPKEYEQFRYAAYGIIIVVVIILFIKSVDLLVTLSTAANGGVLFAMPSLYMITNYKGLMSEVGKTPWITMRNINQRIFYDMIKDKPMLVTGVVLAFITSGIIVQIKTNRKHIYG